VLERRRRIVSRAIDRRSQGRRGERHLEFVVGGNVKHAALPSVVHKLECRLAIPLDHLGVRPGIILRELVKYRPNSREPTLWKGPAPGLADLSRHRDHLVARCFDNWPRLFVELSGRLVDAEIVPEGPVVLGLPHSEAITPKLRLDSRLRL